jgi:Vitamin K-dependent gamma-carboxylase
VRIHLKSSLRNLVKRVSAFLFPTKIDTWLSVLRIGLGVQTILYTVSLRQDWRVLFGETDEAVLGRGLAEKLLSLDSPFVPRLSWLVDLGASVGLTENTVLSIVWVILLCAGLGLTAGVFSRVCAISAWFLHLCAAKSGGVLSYGVDNFMTIGLFYLMLAPAARGWSLENRWRTTVRQDRQLVGFFRRVLQAHLCLIYFFSGLTKCLGTGWWNGSNLWLALTRPPSNFISPEVLISWKQVLPWLGISICLIETGYPFFIWPRRTRTIWLAAVLTMHVAIGLTMGLYLFALVMIVLNVAAFAPESIAGISHWLRRTSTICATPEPKTT